MINEKDLSSGTLVVIAEKPSVAKLIASALDIKKVDVAKGLDCYESNEFVITSAVGHLVEYEKPKKKWSLDALPLNGPGELIPISRSKKESKLDLLVQQKGQLGWWIFPRKIYIAPQPLTKV